MEIKSKSTFLAYTAGAADSPDSWSGFFLFLIVSVWRKVSSLGGYETAGDSTDAGMEGHPFRKSRVLLQLE